MCQKTNTKPSDFSNTEQTKKEFIEKMLEEEEIKKLDLAYHWKITTDNEILVNMYGFPDINKVESTKDIKYVVVYARHSTITGVKELVPKVFDSVELCLDTDKMFEILPII